MSRQRFTLLLIAALVVISCALYLAARRDRPQETQGAALLPSLARQLSAVSAVAIRKAAAPAAVTLQRTGEQWRVKERADYPADVAKIRTLLLALADARIVEEKTADPARFSSIGVEDPAPAAARAPQGPAAMPASAGVLVTVTAADGTSAVIVGKPVGEGSFVRRAGERQSYSVEPAINVEAEPSFWIDSRLLDLSSALIQSIDVTPAAGAAYSLHRLNPADGTYRLDGVPAGRQAEDAHALAPGPTTFSGLAAEDVAPSGDIDFGQASQVVVTLSDGNVVTLTGTVIADKHWIEVKSAKDAALTAKAQGRAFNIASYRYDAIFRPLEQLLVPKPPPKPAVPGASAPAPGAAKAAAAASPHAKPHPAPNPAP
ncbi:MAG: DUF4340 domain-containing protein [Steroidobacteraceae bacterium]